MDRKKFDQFCNDVWEGLEHAQKKHPFFCKDLLRYKGSLGKIHYGRKADELKETNDDLPEAVTGDSIIMEELLEMLYEVAVKEWDNAYAENVDLAATVFRTFEWIERNRKRGKNEQ